MRDYTTNIAKQLGDHSYLPVHFISCLANQRVHQIMERVVELCQQMSKRIDKAELNLALEKIINAHPPHLKGTNIPDPTFHDASQAYGTPPTLIVRCNCARAVISSYRRYMVHGFRRELGFTHVPLRMVLKGRRREVSELA
jgi:GTP-binding protein